MECGPGSASESSIAHRRLPSGAGPEFQPEEKVPPGKQGIWETVCGSLAQSFLPSSPPFVLPPCRAGQDVSGNPDGHLERMAGKAPVMAGIVTEQATIDA